MNIFEISNDQITAKISSLGAELTSLVKNGKERIWEGDAKIWKGHSPILFPICSRVLNGYYTFEDKKYEIGPHGFARNKEFEVVSHEKTSICFLLKSDDETRKVYPFEFEFRVLFKLNGDKIEVYYIVQNNSEKTMYFNVGCHEAYKLENGFKNAYIEFEDDTVLQNTVLSERLMEDEKVEIPLVDRKLKLDMNLFDGEFTAKCGKVYKDSIVVENIKSKRVNLIIDDKEVVSIYYNDFDHMVIWTLSEGYIAIEPWNGLPDFYDTTHDITQKRSISALEPNQSKTFYHSITIGD